MRPSVVQSQWSVGLDRSESWISALAFDHFFTVKRASISAIASPLEPIRLLPFLIFALVHRLPSLSALMLFPVAGLGIAIVLWSPFRITLPSHELSNKLLPSLVLYYYEWAETDP